MPVSKLLKLFTPSATSKFKYHEDIAQIVEAIERHTIIPFASSAERTAVIDALDTSLPEGAMSFLESTGVYESWNGSAWRAVAGEGGVNDAAVTSGTDTCTSATYQNLAGTGSTTSFSFTKGQGGTRIRIDMHATFFSTATSSGAIFGVLINGTDYDVCSLKQAIPVANAHLQASGVKYISDIPAGTYTVQGRWKRDTGAATLTRDNGDWLSISAKETSN